MSTTQDYPILEVASVSRTISGFFDILKYDLVMFIKVWESSATSLSQWIWGRPFFLPVHP